VDELDAACADAGVEQRLVRASLTPAHPAYVACNHIRGSFVKPFKYKLAKIRYIQHNIP
jgi:hypothetical protein